LAKDQILIRALQSGVTGIGILDENDRSYTVEVNVVNDVRQLQAVINHTFPTANITVRPLKDAVVLVGTVPNPEMTAQVVDVASKFSDQVFQNLQVSGAQNIALRMKIYEVSRTKLRRIGADWQISTGNFSFLQSVGDLIGLDADGNAVSTGDTLRASITGSDGSFLGAMEFLEEHDAARLLDEPTLVTLNGRPAEFLSGGEVPILVNAGLGVASIEFRPFGTKVDFLPIVLGDGRLRVDLRYEVSQLAPGLAGDTGTPGFTVSRANVGTEITAGHTLTIAGVIKEQALVTKRGIPGLMHAPWIGAAFGKNRDEVSELRMIVIATPEFIGEVDPSLLPPLGPGQNTQQPLNNEFYFRGYMETPRCDPPADQVGYHGAGMSGAAPAGYQVPFGTPAARTAPTGNAPAAALPYAESAPGPQTGALPFGQGSGRR
jgi:pilus assembly protein CpaC